MRWINCAVLSLFAAVAAAQTTQPTTTESLEPKISSAARAVLSDVRIAYSNLKSLEVAGTISFDMDAGGQKDTEKGEFTGSFQSPQKFRHEMKGDLLLVSNGENAFVYKPDEKKYLPVEMPKERAAASDLPPPVSIGLEQQNPSLLLAICADAASELSQDVISIDRAADVSIDGTKYQALALEFSDQKEQVLIDPQTHLLRQVSLDVKDHLIAQHVPQVNKASVKIDYTKSVADAPLAATTFAWTPPADASLFKPAAQPQDEEVRPATALVGKPAPDFSLKDLLGNDVSLSAFKGHVVVLDFWATWCAPCVVELPSLDQLGKDLSAQGVKILALNVEENQDVVKKFVDKKKLSLTVLLDEKSDVAKKYMEEGLPETVVIGKDGKVKNIFFGYGPASDQNILNAVQSALK